jgi:pimeloyl-ACP methyl ester carboxylesterase
MTASRTPQKSHLFLGAVALLLAMTQAQARPIEQTLSDGKVALADYYAGEPGQAAVLILHGFLQTYQFGTVQSLASELAGRGYTVLAPTLTLGIDRRRTSLDCDAVHTHTLKQDLAEVAAWVEWLAAQGAEEIILIGHSTGSQHLLAYTAAGAHPAVKGVIATSLISLSTWSAEDLYRAQLVKARQQLKAGQPPLGRFFFGFCQGNYVAPPAAFLSYAEKGEAAILESVRNTAVPVDVILGGADKRSPAGWPERLQQAGASLFIIDGASHFFDAMSEFDLLDQVNRCLRHLLQEEAK